LSSREASPAEPTTVSIQPAKTFTPLLLVLSFMAFAVGTQTQLFSGLLPDMAAQFNVPLATVGQLTGVFSGVYALCVPWVASMASRFPPVTLMVVGLLLMAAVNGVSATTDQFNGLIGYRVVCAVLATMINPVATVTATRLVTDQGMASGVVLLGITLAFMVGVPAATLLGHYYSWHVTAVASGLTLLLAAVITWVSLPAQLNQPISGTRGLDDLKVWQSVWPLLVLTLLGFMATFTVTAYIAPVVTMATGLTGQGISVMQAMVGVGSLVGIMVGVTLSQQASKGVVWLFGVIAVSLLLYSVWMWIGPTVPAMPWIMAATIFMGAAALFALMPVMQALLVRQAGIRRQSALALNSAMLFGGQGLGATWGGWILTHSDIHWLGMAGACIALMGCVLSACLTTFDHKAID
jgi:MFS transporter, DHA1 family, inner membrane transport protein